MQLLSGWSERLKKAKPAEMKKHSYVLPKSSDYYARQITFVDSISNAHDMVELAQQRPLSHIGVDMEFRYDRPGVVIDKNNTAYDPRSIHPLVMSLAFAEPDADNGNLYPFVVDLAIRDLFPAIETILQLSVPFVGHFMKGDLFCLLQLELPEPRTLWDTYIHEKALRLGRNHRAYKLPVKSDEGDEAQVKEEVEEGDRFNYSLVATCQRYGITYSAAGDKTRLQKSFLNHLDGASFSKEQIDYAAEDAIAVARLYPHQVNTAAQAGLLQHLICTEMPWGKTNTHMEWHGVRVDPEKRQQVIDACNLHLPELERRLAEHGIRNARSHPQLKAFFEQIGLLHLFRHHGKYSFDKKQLRLFQDRHSTISLIRAVRRIHDLRASKIVSNEFEGADGRVHPFHRQLGTHTGRQTSKWPNILGLERVLRPLIVPDSGCGIGEVDYSQIEVGIAAAVYQDSKLIEMYNSEDVYSAMAQHFYSDQLPEEDHSLPGSDFKRKHPELRERMKIATLGIIYGMTAHGLSLYLNTKKAEAAVLQRRFMKMFPKLKEALSCASVFGAIRGYASTMTGLRRYRARRGRLSNWEKNWLTNHPVQGSAAVVFKVAGNRLDLFYQQYGARLIIPLHDAFVFEAPMEVLSEVALLTERVMCETVREYFPELHPKAEVNIRRPDCWNKDGDADALIRWLKDPLIEVGIKGCPPC